MARLPRYVAPGQPQHVIQRGNNRSRIFATRQDYGFFLDCLGAACARHACEIHAYVLMTNHVHMLMTPLEAHSISKVLQSVGRRYVQHFNKAHQRTGTLWEGRYRATPIDSERYLLTCCRYIELNPVRAGLARRPEAYEWSSYRANAEGITDKLVTPHPLFQRLGPDPVRRRAAYRNLFRVAIDEETIHEIRAATNKGWVLGSERYQQRIAELARRRSRPLARGPAPGRRKAELTS